jgi:CO dehydrogenase maturation factor
MAIRIAVAGKGGTGKTTICSIIVQYLLAKGLIPVLAVDADSNINLNQMLGVEVKRTIGEARELVRRKSANGPPETMTKEDFLEYKIREALVESEGFDLLAMGRPEGPGCYCYANTLLSKSMEMLLKGYRYIVIDNEAGMEHISRLTTSSVDLLIIVSEPAKRGIITAGRIRDLIQELKLEVKHTYLIVNRVPDGLDPKLHEEINRLQLKLAGAVPLDNHIYQLDLDGRPTTELPGDSTALQAVNTILRKIIKLL